MAPSNATAILIDVSAEMATKVDETDTVDALQRARQLASMAVSNMMRAQKKKDVILLLAFGADKSDNPLYDGDNAYSNIVQLQQLGPCGRDTIKCLQQDESLESTSDQVESELGGGIQVAQSELERFVGKKKYTKRIIILTNGRGCNTDSFLRGANEDLDSTCFYDIVLISSKKAENERVRELLAAAESTAKQNVSIVPELEFEKELIKAHGHSHSQTTLFKGLLRISDSVAFWVQCYTKCATETPPSLKKASKVALSQNPESRYVQGAALVGRETFFTQPDNADEEVDKTATVNGFRFGRQSIPFNEGDDFLRTYHTGSKKLDVIGFSPLEHVPHFYNMRKCDVFEAMPYLYQSRLGLSAFIRALVETQKAPICRFIARENAKVKIVALIPYISDDGKQECLFSRELPFEQDLRSFAFDPITDQKYLPRSEQLESMRELVNSMYVGDSSLVKIEGAEVPTGREEFIPEETLNPFLERLYLLLEFRMKDPSCPIPQDPAYVKKLFSPSTEVLSRSAAAAEKAQHVFNIKENVVEKGSKRKSRDDLWGNPGDDENADKSKRTKVESDVGLVGLVGVQTGDQRQNGNATSDWFGASRVVDAVGSVDPVKDYEAMNARTDKDLSEEAFKGICKQIDLLIEPETSNSVFRAKGLECLRAARKGSIKHNTEEQFNTYLQNLKGASNEDFWKLLVEENLSLISADECVSSTVSSEESRKFLQPEDVAAPANIIVAPIKTDNDEEFDELE